MYFSTDSQQTVRWLAAVIATAAKNEQRIRLDVDSRGKLRVKRGEGGWSAPIESSRDPYRDGSPEQRPALYVGDHGEPVVRPLESHDARAETIANTIGVPYYGD